MAINHRKIDTREIWELLRLRYPRALVEKFCFQAVWAVLAGISAGFPELNVKGPEFELFGADVLPTAGLKPVLVEINAYPSLAPSGAADLAMKKRVVQDLLGLAELWGREQKKSFGPARFGSWL